MSRVLHVLPDLARGGGRRVVPRLVAHADCDRFEPLVVAPARPDDLLEYCADVRTRPIGADDIGSLTRAWSRSKAEIRGRVERRTCAAYIAGDEDVAHLHRRLVHTEVVTVLNGVDLIWFAVAIREARPETRANRGLGADSSVLVRVEGLAQVSVLDPTEGMRESIG